MRKALPSLIALSASGVSVWFIGRPSISARSASHSLSDNGRKLAGSTAARRMNSESMVHVASSFDRPRSDGERFEESELVG